MSEEKNQQEVKKNCKFVNAVPVNIKVNILQQEYEFVHPEKLKEIVSGFEKKILDLEQSIAFQKATLNKINRLISDTYPF